MPLPSIELDQLDILYEMTHKTYGKYVDAQLNRDEINVLRYNKEYIRHLEGMGEMITRIIESEQSGSYIRGKIEKNPQGHHTGYKSLEDLKKITKKFISDIFNT